MKKIIIKILIFILLFIPVFQTKAWLAELEPQLSPWVWAFLKSFVNANLWKLDFLKKIVEIINRDLSKYTPTQQVALTYFKLLIEEWISNWWTYKVENPIKFNIPWWDIVVWTNWYWFKDFNTSRTVTLTSMTEWALKSAIAWGWTIKIPAWTINISGQINLKSNTKLIWAWKNNTKIHYTWWSLFWIFKIKWINNVVIQWITLDGKWAWWWKIVWIHTAWWAKNILIKWNRITNLWTWDRVSEGMIFWRNDVWYFTFDSNELTNIWLHWLETHWSDAWGSGRSHHWIISNNIFKDNWMGMDISSYSHHIDVLNNTFIDNNWWAKIVNAQNIKFNYNKFSQKGWWYTFDFQQTDWYGFHNKNIEFAYNKKIWPITSIDQWWEYWNNVNSHDNSF